MSGADTVREWAGRMRDLASLNRDAAALAVPRVRAAVRATAAAGTTPTGEAWVPTVDGKRPLDRVAEKIEVTADGSRLEIALRGHDVFHQEGTKRTPQRQVIPSPGDPIPPAVEAALKASATEAFQRTVGGAR